ncbi:MAG TPA: MotA/TolQ/ExbB proton channel family protein [Acidobacteriaceae bacterium]|nr:MotA/TolQ/ExbB proton channel family protein [Acidobacteriaceae bacterium]
MIITLSHLALFLFQTEDAAPPPAAIGHSSGAAIVDMVRNSGPIALGVLVLLLIASLYSWSIILSKLASFKRARVQSGRFVRAFRKAERLHDIAAVAEQFKPSPLVPIFEDTYEEYRRQTGGIGPPRSMTALERAAQSAASEALTQMEQRMTWLATIGAITPFLGLFGTIMGIIDAFHGLGTAGAATLRAVAPGVSEALITTAAGIAVAVPSVIAYNQLTARVREFGAHMDDFAREVLNALEDVPTAAPSPLAAVIEEPVRGLHR